MKKLPLSVAMFLAAGFSTASIACNTDAPIVHSSGLSTAPFERYQSFSFGRPEDPPPLTNDSLRGIEVRRRTKGFIAEALAAKGYVLSKDKGDFVVMFGAGRDERKLDANEDMGCLVLICNEDLAVGALVVDMFDGGNDGQVWHGASKVRIDPNQGVNIPLLEQSVHDVLARFPNARHPAKNVASADR